MFMFVFLFCVLILFPGTAPLIAETRVETHFENTDHELTVYYIKGKEPGKTMMIIGGIQGDEPGGYIAADLYADMLLEKGNLIVVPRANFFSIKKNKRGVNGDMNRKFANKSPEKSDYDSRIVDILKNLMSQSDVLLNLHEGSGYYYPEYISKLKNPLRYGQSIIIDALRYRRQDETHIELEEPSINVIEEMNRNIKNPEHRFHLNNHDTFSDLTRHAEQRGSATYNALTLFGIPGYGIETSKNIKSIETKVKYETLAINAFMREYGIVPEHPSIYLPTPELYHLVITITGNPNPSAVKNGSMLTIQEGTSINVTSVVANYNRGISVDIIGHGNTNDIGRVTVISSPTTIKVFKDAYLCGEVPVKISHAKKRILKPARLEQVEIKVCDKNYVVSAGDTLHIVRGDIIRLVDAWTTDRADLDFRINFYGFVGNKTFNDAEDRGYDIDTAKDLIKRLSLGGKGHIYRIEALKGRKVIGSIHIAIEEPEIRYVIVELEDGTKQALTPGQEISCNGSETLMILSIVSNVTAKPYINTFISNGKGQYEKLILPAILKNPLNSTIQFKRTTVDLGFISFLTAGKT